MREKERLTRVNKLLIMIVLGTFTLAELLYLAPEYKWGVGEVCRLMATILK